LDKAEETKGPEVKPLLPVEVALGQALVGAWGNVEAALAERVGLFRKQYTEDFGMVVPSVVFHDSAKLAPNEYEIQISGGRVGRGVIYPDQTLAIHTATNMPPLRGTVTKDPAFGLPGVWIAESQRDVARQGGYTLVDAMTVLVTHLTETLKTNASQLLTRTDTVKLLDGVRSRQPGLVEELVPTVLAVSDVQRTLQNLLSEQVSIRNLDLIVEVLADAGRSQKDPAILTDIVRQKLGLPICQSLRGNQDALSVLTMDPALESIITHGVQSGDGGGAFVLDPRLAEQFLKKLLTFAENMMRSNLSPVLLCSPEMRRHIKSFTRRAVPRLAVVAISEVPTSIDLKSFGVVSIPIDKQSPVPGVA
jgi:flagellar biosynthesis protein FlhA